MSEETTELTTEEKKKAINLQDLVYVKKYIDDNHYDKAETDNIVVGEITKQVNNAVAENMTDKYYDKTTADKTFYKRGDKVSYADHAIGSNNAIYSSETSAIRIDNMDPAMIIRAVTPDEYENGEKRDKVLYLIKES